MSRRASGALIVLIVVLLVGAASLLSLRSPEVDRSQADAEGHQSAVGDRASKSGRGAESRHAVAHAALAGPVEGRTWKVAEGNREVMHEMVERRKRSSSGPVEVGPAGVEPDRGSKRPEASHTGGATPSGEDLAQQAQAHRRGRREFMRQRQAELTAHQPGCKCAYHLGE